MATKKTIKENPITTFRKNFENRSKIVKSSLKKAQNGIIAGPQTEMQSKFSDAMNSQPPIPRPNRESIFNSYNPQNNIRTANEMNVNDGTKIQNQLSLDKRQLYDKQRMADEQYKKALLNRPKQNYIRDDNLEEERSDKQKKGGPIKYKKGGATKAVKFAALAKPFNKATAADRIAGAKKNARKK